MKKVLTDADSNLLPTLICAAQLGDEHCKKLKKIVNFKWEDLEENPEFYQKVFMLFVASLRFDLLPYVFSETEESVLFPIKLTALFNVKEVYYYHWLESLKFSGDKNKVNVVREKDRLVKQKNNLEASPLREMLQQLGDIDDKLTNYDLPRVAEYFASKQPESSDKTAVGQLEYNLYEI